MTTSSTLTNNGSVSNATERAHQTLDRMAEKAAPALERARTGVHQTIDKVADTAVSGAEWAAENGKALATRSSEFTDTCAEYVRARPIVAVAGALALGYLMGRMAR